MAMPIDFVLVRHGQSEGNLANKYAYQGDNRHYTEDFRNRHSSQWRLTEQGVEEAKVAGDWIKENIGGEFDRYYTSEHIRAMETSYHLNMSDAVWYSDFFLRERDGGDFESLPPNERKKKYAEAMKKKDLDAFYWTPPNGESVANLCIRLKWMLDTFYRECSDRKLIGVCYGEVMSGFRVLLERMPQRKFLEIDSSDDPNDRVNNCQIYHFSRVNPKTKKVEPYLNWFRSICPWDPSLSSNKWEKIERPIYENQDLKKQVDKISRIVKEAK